MLKLRTVTAGYDGIPVIHVDSLSVSSGEVVAILGPSGCGKTTLFQVIAGLLPAQSGEIQINEQSDFSNIRHNVSQTLQGFPLYHWLTVKQNLKLAAQIKGVEKVDLYHVLRQFSAVHIADKYPGSISGGERCRASISQAILTKPTVLLLDEPFIGLDTLTKRAIASNLFNFAHDNDVSVLMITHDVHDAIERADTVVVLGRSDDGISRIHERFDAAEITSPDIVITALERVARL